MLGLVGCSGAKDSGMGYDLNDTPSADEENFLVLVNRLRQDQGVGPLQIEAHLQASSRHHSKYMVSHDFLDHDEVGADEQYFNRITRAGGNFSTSSENIASGSSNAESAYQSWYGSPDHYRAMISPDYQHIGIAKEGTYWTTDFGGK